MRGKYKRLTDLYVEGTEVNLADGNILWMQALNPYEREEALHDAQVARSRLVMALKDGGQERLKVQARFIEVGRDGIIDEMVTQRGNAKFSEFIDEIKDDKDWKERLEILERTDEANAAEPLTEEEVNLLTKVQTEYFEEIGRRQTEEQDYQRRQLERLSDEQLQEEYLEAWLDTRGTALATGEYLLTEIWYGARACDAVNESGIWNHAACNGHVERVFESKGEVRSLPESLQGLLRDAISELSWTPREAKNSDRQESSSDSSLLPSEPAESTPSTPTATPDAAPGTSARRSRTA